MYNTEDKILWQVFKSGKKDFLKEVHEEFRKSPNSFLIVREGSKISSEDEKENINTIASRDAFIRIIDMNKNHFKGTPLQKFIDFMNNNYAHNEECKARVDIINGNYSAIESFLKKYWIRNLKRSLPDKDIKTEKEFYNHLEYLVKLPNFETYGQHFWTLHSSNKANPIYKDFYNLHVQNIIKDYPLINLNQIKIKDVNWII